MQNFCMKVSLSFRKPVKVANLENVNEIKFIQIGLKIMLYGVAT